MKKAIAMILTTIMTATTAFLPVGAAEDSLDWTILPPRDDSQYIMTVDTENGLINGMAVDEMGSGNFISMRPLVWEGGVAFYLTANNADGTYSIISLPPEAAQWLYKVRVSGSEENAEFVEGSISLNMTDEGTYSLFVLDSEISKVLVEELEKSDGQTYLQFGGMCNELSFCQFTMNNSGNFADVYEYICQ